MSFSKLNILQKSCPHLFTHYQEALRISSHSISYSLNCFDRNKPKSILSQTRQLPALSLQQNSRCFSNQVKDNIMTIPNGLCVARIAMTPIIGFLVVQSQFMPACVLFTIAGITDLLDGQIARRYESQRSLLGSILDPVADKFLLSTMFVALTYVNLIPLYLTSIVLLRDVCLVVGGFVRRYQILDPPITLKRFFDPNVSAVQVKPTFVSKLNTALQLSLVTFSLASPVFDFIDHPALAALGVVTCATTIYSGLQYVDGGAMKRI